MRKWLIGFGILLLISYLGYSISTKTLSREVEIKSSSEDSPIREPSEAVINRHLTLVSGVNKEIPSNEQVVYIREGDTLALYPVWIAEGEYYASVDEVLIDDEHIDIEPIENKEQVYWYRILPDLRAYDNVAGATKDNLVTYKEPITYTYQLIDNGFIDDILEEKNYGTYYVTCLDQAVSRDEAIFKTIGAIHKEIDSVIQIVYRPDDTYLGYIQELFHTPFIMAPKSVKGQYHQTDQRIGSDCAELAIYGRRRLGYDVPYCGPKGIYGYTDTIVQMSKLSDDGIRYVDESNNKIAVGEGGGILPGDILHFGPQLSVFYRDQGTLGYLDREDLLIQSFDVTPVVTTIAACGFFEWDFRILRFRK